MLGQRESRKKNVLVAQRRVFEPCGPGFFKSRRTTSERPQWSGRAGLPAVFSCKGLRSAGTSGAGLGPKDGEEVAGSGPSVMPHMPQTTGTSTRVAFKARRCRTSWPGENLTEQRQKHDDDDDRFLLGRVLDDRLAVGSNFCHSAHDVVDVLVRQLSWHGRCCNLRLASKLALYPEAGLRHSPFEARTSCRVDLSLQPGTDASLSWPGECKKLGIPRHGWSS